MKEELNPGPLCIIMSLNNVIELLDWEYTDDKYTDDKQIKPIEKALIKIKYISGNKCGDDAIL